MLGSNGLHHHRANEGDAAMETRLETRRISWPR
jgi:hypothetical protein